MSVDVLDPNVAKTPTAEESSFSGEGMLAMFAGPDELVAATKRAKETGYERIDAFTPFPIHALDNAMGLRETTLPWIALVAGVAGGVGALAMQWWMNAVDYPYLISGKPLFSLPANIPVTFEVVILSAAFAAFFGMLALNRLPRLANPLLEHERFRRASDDSFFLYIAADDPNFDSDRITELFRASGAIAIDIVTASTTPSQLPRWVHGAGAVALALSLIPPAFIFWVRNTKSDSPRIDFFADMDSQRSYRAQEATDLFADGRAMRPQPQGTIAVGELNENDAFYRGRSPSAELDDGADRTDAADAAYVDQFPTPVTNSLMRRGQRQYNIYCASCHGLAGQGDGLVALRANELQESTWTPPSNLTNSAVATQPVGKLFDTITNGRRRMAGLSTQIQVEDRWAIVLYLRALQRSQAATLDSVPPATRKTLEALR